MIGLPLLDWAPLARATDPETSHIAGSRDQAQRHRDRDAVLAAHCANPMGLTDFELSAILRRQQTSVGKRRGELRDAGLIAATEDRRPSPSGSPAIVWRITSAGAAAIVETQTRVTVNRMGTAAPAEPMEDEHASNR